MYEASEAFQVGDGASERLEPEVHRVMPRRQRDGAENDIGAEDLDRLSVERGVPPRMPDVVEQQQPAVRRIDRNVDLGIGITLDPRRAGPA